MIKFTLSSRRISHASMAGMMPVRSRSAASPVPRASPVRIDLDKLVTRHSAVLGSTGAGKSTTVTSLLRSLSVGQGGNGRASPARAVLLIDIHGEYGRALGEVARVFRVNPLAGESPLYVPYWALDLGDLLGFLLGKTDEKALTAIQDRILAMKGRGAGERHIPRRRPELAHRGKSASLQPEIAVVQPGRPGTQDLEREYAEDVGANSSG